MCAFSVTGIYETHLTVRHLLTSISFYRDTLGLALASEFPDRRVAFFWVGGRDQGMLGLWETGSGPNRMALHFAFRASLPSVLAACTTLRQAGVTPLDFHGQPTDSPVVLGWMPAASVYFTDPDGHSLELICPIDAPADPGFGIGTYAGWVARHGQPGNPA